MQIEEHCLIFFRPTFDSLFHLAHKFPLMPLQTTIDLPLKLTLDTITAEIIFLQLFSILRTKTDSRLMRKENLIDSNSKKYAYEQIEDELLGDMGEVLSQLGQLHLNVLLSLTYVCLCCCINIHILA